MEALLNFIVGFGFLAVLFVVYAESGLLIGFFFPGDSLLFISGTLVHSGVFDINIHLFVFLLFLAAVLGDSTGYTFGRRVGRKLFERENSKIFKKKYLLQAEAFYQKHGPIAIVLARFVPIVRTFAPIVAGIGKMHYNKFLAYNIIGGLLWTTIFTYMGFYVGKILQDAGFHIEVIALIIIFISVLPIAIHALNTKEKRASAWKAIKAIINKVFKKDIKDLSK